MIRVRDEATQVLPAVLRERVVVGSSQRAPGMAGVHDPCWLDEQRVDFAFCDRAMLDTSRCDEQLSG